MTYGKECIEAAKKWFPNQSDKAYADLLMSATAFPFAPADIIAQQLEDAFKICGNNVGKAIHWASINMDFESEGFQLEVQTE